MQPRDSVNHLSILSKTHLHKFIATLLQPLGGRKGLASVHSLILLVRTETEG
jgi:hypothetical protein